MKLEQSVSFFVKKEILEKYMKDHPDALLFHFNALVGEKGEIILTINPVRENSLLTKGSGDLFKNQTTGSC